MSLYNVCSVIDHLNSRRKRFMSLYNVCGVINHVNSS